MKISKLMHRVFYDDRHRPMIQGGIFLQDGSFFTGCIPALDFSGALNEKEMEESIKICEQILAPALIEKEVRIPDIDYLLLDTTNSAGISLDEFSVNRYFILALSIAIYKAYAHQEHVELYELFAYLLGSESVTLPCPQFTLLTGKRTMHDLRVQEFLVAPLGSITLRSALELCLTVAEEVQENAMCLHGIINPAFDDREVLDFIGMVLGKAAIESDAGMCALALNFDASKCYDKEQGKYFFNNAFYPSDDLINFYGELIKTYPIYSIEDGLESNDWEKWRLMTETLGNKIQIVGNTLFSPDPERLHFIAQNNIATAMTIKPHQCMTILEIMQAVAACRQNKLNVIISYPFGDVEDVFMTDLTIGTGAGQIKIGSCPPSEWPTRYERLFSIEDTLRMGTAKI